MITPKLLRTLWYVSDETPPGQGMAPQTMKRKRQIRNYNNRTGQELEGCRGQRLTALTTWRSCGQKSRDSDRTPSTSEVKESSATRHVQHNSSDR